MQTLLCPHWAPCHAGQEDDRFMRELKPNVYFVGAIDWDRRLFDELVPLPDGTSYNAYLIIGSDKTALLDTVDPTKTDELIENLDKSGIGKIDYGAHT